MAPDLIIYAIVAAGLVLWLRSILGTRHGSERERLNPFALSEGAAPVTQKTDAEGRIQTPQDRITELAATSGKVVSIENKTAEMGLLDIAKVDKNFDIDFFMNGVQEAFVMVVEAFARGDRETLKDLLEPSVYHAFNAAIDDRDARSETMNAEILAVRRAEVTEAKITGRMAFITVRFQADEITVTKDKNGVVLSGHPDRVMPMRDLWTFSRDLRGRDPRWLVSETRGDLEGDNQIIPNAD